jgi:hypothetical protein
VFETSCDERSRVLVMCGLGKCSWVMSTSADTAIMRSSARELRALLSARMSRVGLILVYGTRGVQLHGADRGRQHEEGARKRS